MRVSIIVPDRRVVIDGSGKRLDLDWSPFEAVHAVQAWLDRDRAEVEFREIDPDGDGPLPAVKPPNELIDAATFTERFGSLVQAWFSHVEEEPAPVPASSGGGGEAVDPIADIRAELAALKSRNEILERQVAVFINEAGGGG